MTSAFKEFSLTSAVTESSLTQTESSGKVDKEVQEGNRIDLPEREENFPTQSKHGYVPGLE